ncbi:helix-turn-helix domain-containing protein [Spirosoma sordidisoli]|uniref:XRE family transcriptional regulator n=1 Tax=Spirosoma sordidisoli TaxID=2502893 RepID=A0A4Q2UMQ4_9BACT|nr:helix-turn-helix transcriptional regulator [Spirosoma sordidisoli]RYC70674.1 XRE family transcriptional regulator [Spirosoma sordidisoli]
MLKQQTAEQLKNARKAQGLTQKQVGELLGIDESTYNRYESGTANLSLDTIEKIVKALNKSVTILIQ